MTETRTRTRLTLDLSDRLDQALAELADRNGWTKADTLRKGLSLLAKIDRTKREGFELVARRHDGRQVIEREVGTW